MRGKVREEKRTAESSRKTEQALRECAKQRDLEEFARDLTRLKERQGAVQARPATRREVIGPKRSVLPPLKRPTPANPAPSTPVVQERDFVYDSSKPLEGIIAHLTRECHGNVHSKGVVNVTASSVHKNDMHWGPENAVELGTDSAYASKNERDTWLCYDFLGRRVIPTSYSVRSYSGGVGGSHLKSWVIEVSNDGYSWTQIDRRDNNNDLNNSFVTANFKIKKKASVFSVSNRLERTIIRGYPIMSQSLR